MTNAFVSFSDSLILLADDDDDDEEEFEIMDPWGDVPEECSSGEKVYYSEMLWPERARLS